VAARYFAGTEMDTIFASNNEIDNVLQAYAPQHPEVEQLWITDISWRQDSTDAHLNRLIDDGLEVYWVDHHKSAIDRRADGHLDVKFTDYVLEDTYAASRLLFEFLCARSTKRGESKPGLLALRNLVMMADDVDRWLLNIDGSRELGLAVRAMDQASAYRVLLSMDSRLTYGPELLRARERVQSELRRTFEIADRTRYVEDVPALGLKVVSAECDGYAGEVAHRWTDEFENAVFAIYDHHTNGVSLRRTPDSSIDLSRLASAFDGGGHAAASGCNIPASPERRSAEIASKITDVLTKDPQP
jgi:hypothetical protein